MSERRASLQVEIGADGVVAGERRVIRSVDEIRRAAGNLDGTVKRTDTTLNGLGSTSSRTATLLRGLGGVLTTIASAAVLGRIISVTREFEQLRARLETVTGSASRGASAFAALQKMAASTPFQVTELTDAYIRLQAQGIAPTESLMRSLGNTASAMGKGLVQASEALLDAQMGEFERLKEFGIKARKEGDMVAFTFKGVTTQVENNSAAIVGYLENIGNTDFVGAMERQSKTLNGALSNLADASAALMDQVGSSGLARELGILAQQMSATAASGDNAAQRLGRGLGFIVGIAGTIPEVFILAAGASEHALGRITQAVSLVANRYIAAYRAMLEAGSGVAKALGFGNLVEVAGAQLDSLLDTTRRWAEEGAAVAADGAERAADSILNLQGAWSALEDRMKAGATASEGAAAGLDGVAGSAGAAGAALGLSVEDAKKFASTLQDILDRLDPVAAAERNLAEEIAIVSQALAAGGPKADAYREALRKLKDEMAGLREIAEHTIPLLDVPDRTPPKPIDVPPTPEATLRISQDSYTELEKKLDEANEAFSGNLEQGMEGAFSAALVEFANGGKDALKHFGENLLQVLIQAVAEYLTKMLSALVTELAQRLSNVAVEAGARQMTGAATSATGAGTDALVGAGASAGASSAGTGAMAGLGTFVAVIAVFAAAVALFKHESDRAIAVRYGTTSGVKVTDGMAVDGFSGKLSESGPKVAAAIGALLNAFQTSTGSFMEGIATAEVQIRNDKTQFRAVVNGIMIGQFNTAGEAIIAAAKAAFLGSNLSRELDPMVRRVIEQFSGSDPAVLIKAMQSVQGIVDKLSGISEVEVRMRELPARTAALAAELVGLGIAFDEARDMADRWRVSELQSIRDELTGRQKTNAELMVEQQRKAAMYNAEVTLFKAETQMKRDDIALRVAVLRASGDLFEGQAALDIANLQFNRDVLMNKADLYDKEAEISQWYLETLGATANASIIMLEAQLAALDVMLANMPDLISPGEVRLPNFGGGGGGIGTVDSGPSEAEQRILDFNEFLRTRGLEALTDYQRGMAELNRSFDEQLRAAREVIGGEEALAAARRAAANALRDDLIDGFGTPLEAVRDRIAAMQGQMHDFYLSNVELQRQFDAGEISADEFAEAVRRSREVMGEFGQMMRAELMGLALYFTDAMGNTAASAQIRADLAQLEWTFKKAEMRLLLEAIRLIPGAMPDDDYKRWLNFLANLPDKAPGPPPPPTDEGPDNGVNDAMEEARKKREDALRTALDRLRGALVNYTQFLKDLETGPLSGNTIQQDANAAQAEYERLLALAQAGNLDAIELLPAAAQQYLEAAAQFLDPSSSGYQAILALVQGQMAGMQDMINAFLANVPTQMSGVEDRLDTLIEIQQAIAGLPVAPDGGSNPHAGLVYYGPQYGWHPPGWSPSGGGDPGNFSAGSAFRFAASSDPARNVVAAKFGVNTSGVIDVQDQAATAALAKVDAKLSRLEAAQVDDTRKSERQRRRMDPRGLKHVGGFYRDEVAS